MREIFVYEICKYLATNSGGRFTFGAGNTNLKVGELTMSTNGVFAVTTPSIAPDKETAVEYYQIDFWAKNDSTLNAYSDLGYIYDFFHQEQNYSINSYYIYLSTCQGQIDDNDRDGENRKILKLSIQFITRPLIS